jgi:metallo-beta-lactamase family protein
MCRTRSAGAGFLFVTIKFTFHGAAGEVTGSCCHVACPDTEFLVDCGMFQGGHEAATRNAHSPPVDPVAQRFVVLTHAHLDHSGLLPAFAACGFGGPIYATPATCDLVAVLWRDSANIQEREAAWAEERGAAGHAGGHGDDAPLYNMADVECCLAQLHLVDYDSEVVPAPGLRLRLRDAGHILGSAIAEIWHGTRERATKFVFSGDLGQPGSPLHPAPAQIAEGDIIVVESTYGNRLHKSFVATLNETAQVLCNTLPRGNVVIPAFAVGRTQEMLYVLADLARQGRVPRLNVFVDSPLATAATTIQTRHAYLLNAATHGLSEWLTSDQDRIRIKFTESPEESKTINTITRGAVIVSASGMCDAGRVKHHLKHNLPRCECAVVFVGFQAAGTLGRQLVDGGREVRIFRTPVPVRASVHTIGGLSAHADQAALLAWLGAFTAPPDRAFVVHGEFQTATEFAALAQSRLAWRDVRVPARGESFDVA